MLQGAGGKGVSEIVKSGGGAARPLQYGGQLLPHRGGVQRGVLFLRGWEHPVGTDALPVLCQDLQDGGGQENAPTGGTGLGLGDRQLPLDALNLPLYSQGASPEIQIIPPEGQDLAPAQAGG